MITEKIDLTKEINTVFPLLHNDSRSSSWMCFNAPYVAYVYYPYYRVDILSGKRIKYSIHSFTKRLERFRFNKDLKDFPNKYPKVFHLSYEYGLYINTITSIRKIPRDLILAIEVHYKKAQKFSQTEFDSILKSGCSGMNKKRSAPASDALVEVRELSKINYSLYKRKFKQVQKELLAGNCYQINLTFPFVYSCNINGNGNQLIYSLYQKINSKLSSISAYAHFTNIPSMNLFIMSNSPECLFNIHRGKQQMSLTSTPIKGSANLPDTKKSTLKKVWRELLKSKKDQGELFMIADLIRNDLNRIEKPSAKILASRRPLVVPKILHQYSLIQVDLSNQINLLQILKSIYPGGSITGAPKRRVMQILQALEIAPRGFYTGSTLIFHRSLARASINIRTAIIDLTSTRLKSAVAKIHYHSGGGITLLSRCECEYQEMNLKVESFIDNFFQKGR